MIGNTKFLTGEILQAGGFLPLQEGSWWLRLAGLEEEGVGVGLILRRGVGAAFAVSLIQLDVELQWEEQELVELPGRVVRTELELEHLLDGLVG